MVVIVMVKVSSILCVVIMVCDNYDGGGGICDVIVFCAVDGCNGHNSEICNMVEMMVLLFISNTTSTLRF